MSNTSNVSKKGGGNVSLIKSFQTILEKLLSSFAEQAKQRDDEIKTLISELHDSRSQQDALLKTFCEEHRTLVHHLDQMVAEMATDRTRTTNVTNPLTANIDLSTRVGNHLFLAGTTVPQRIADNPWTVNSTNYAEIMAYLNTLKTINGFDFAFMVPTDGTGELFTSPKILSSGEKRANVDLQKRKCMVEFCAQISTPDVLKYAGFIHGDNTTGLSRSTDMVQKALNFSVADENELLVAQYKNQLRIRSEMLYIVLNKCITKSSLDTFLKSNKDKLQYTREADGTPFFCGFTLLWYILEALEPKSVIDAAKYEKKIESATLADFQSCVRSYIAEVKGAYDDLRSRHGENRMTESKFVEHVFNGLQSATNPMFKEVLTSSRTLWLTDSSKFNVDVFLSKLENVYNALITANTWNEVDATEQKVIALTTEVKNVKKENTKLRKQVQAAGGGDKNTQQSGQPNGPPYMKNGVEMAGAPGTSDHNIQKWRTINSGEFKNDPKSGVRHQWCKEHRRSKGLYMLCNSEDKQFHDHAKWKESLPARKIRAEKAGGAGEESSSSGSKKRKDSPTKLKVTAGVKSSRKTAFVTSLTMKGLDHHQAEEVWEELHGTSDEESSK